MEELTDDNVTSGCYSSERMSRSVNSVLVGRAYGGWTVTTTPPFSFAMLIAHADHVVTCDTRGRSDRPLLLRDLKRRKKRNCG